MQRVRCYLAPPTCFSSICVSGAAFPWFGPRPCRFRVGRDNGHVGTLSWAGPSSGPSLVIIRGEVCFALLQIITAIFRGRARELSLPWMSTISWPKHPHCKLYYLTKIFAVYPWSLNLKDPQRLSTPITSEIQPLKLRLNLTLSWSSKKKKIFAVRVCTRVGRVGLSGC